MHLTKEQERIIATQTHIKVQAIAGAGKTSTIIAYAESRPAHAKILYIVFNASAKQEAQEKFKQRNLTNVTVTTAHALAYQYMITDAGYTVRSTEYALDDLVYMLDISGSRSHTMRIAHHVKKYMALYCNSIETDMDRIAYASYLTDAETLDFFTTHSACIIEKAKLWFTFMDTQQCDSTHDFYLKKFHLCIPDLGYDYVLFDEAQDASGAMLGIFLAQKDSVKVMVGDTHQQIYSWRYAVNSLEYVDFPEYRLSASFRFHADIADLATRILSLKKYVTTYDTITITGKGAYRDMPRTYATIARTNLGLLRMVLAYLEMCTDDVPRLYFEGTLRSYMYGVMDGALHDIFALYTGAYHDMRDPFLKTFTSYEALETYALSVHDVSLGLMIDMVKRYREELPAVIATIQSYHVDDRSTAQHIFSTVHKCKGMEYDHITLADDFITEQALVNIDTNTAHPQDIAKAIEEINLLYVAVTRAHGYVVLPARYRTESLDVDSPYIQWVDEAEEGYRAYKKPVS
ncbi:MAG: UvrD-helicase domain-containing protein [Candidatus Pacebacteria bacterium]|nr:UvrD-helicase domain-containing protein [Candidatus Paceibacterota bacterium]MCD8508404.1 UvrD-helicase domain-containing protein [Candidatus Paceibacterota bacterium]MCD8527925.1 UvrD-helicase domain-containing protein [Candidatus Paceibacterota bacterium]MCD8563719.1 UvrD-helicase domain-containing protein [Candidatus Paceibacterota bacterium]